MSQLFETFRLFWRLQNLVEGLFGIIYAVWERLYFKHLRLMPAWEVFGILYVNRPSVPKFFVSNYVVFAFLPDDTGPEFTITIKTARRFRGGKQLHP